MSIIRFPKFGPRPSPMRELASSPENEAREMQSIGIGAGNLRLSIMIYRQAVSELKPLLIVNSVDFPMPPSQRFCDQMWTAGYQVIFIRRPGFGCSPGLPDILLEEEKVRAGAAVVTEAAILDQLVRTLDLEDIVLLGMGSANPVCYRLSLICPKISFSVFSNALFNQDILDVFEPVWFRGMLRQTMGTKAGLHFATHGVKYLLKNDAESFYKQVLQKSRGDLDYLEHNKADFLKASELICAIEPNTFAYDLKMSLEPDPHLKDDFFKNIRAVALSGMETTPLWKSQLEAEAKRLALPVEYLPSGDLYAPYASADHFLDLLARYDRNPTIPIAALN